MNIDTPGNSQISRNQQKSKRYYLKSRGNVVFPSNPFITFGKQDIEQSIPARFQEQVRKYPHNIAVHTKNYHWTYSELNCRANQVAQAIQLQCTFGEEKIALLFEHDAPMVAAILGVLKSGKTYVPLDPNYPSDRVVYILEDSLASAVLTNNKNLARAQELTKGIIPLINIDDISFAGSSNEIKQEISPDTIAYILYTSGSTGQPKGVIQNHRNVLHFIRNYTNNLHINEQDGLTLLSSYSFDAAIMDIFAAILNGATLYPINIKESGLTHLSQWLRQHHITIYHSTPTLYRHFVSTLSGDEQLTNIRIVVLGGEEVVKTDVDFYKEHFSDECIFVNGLGATEASFYLQYFINKETKITRNTVPVGYPVEDTEIFLLNEAGEKTDIYGEIAIRSPYVALGYWHKPNLTQAVFLSDPECASLRIYRTGDLGRLRPDGSIEFLGRKDFQVKVRGFRIELGEIEAVLHQHPQVHSVVVIARQDQPSAQRLVAYIVPQQDTAPTISELRQFLKTKLPEYMVPSAFVMLESLPLTPNGKVDRRALPDPELDRELLDKYVAPRTPIEEVLAQIWAGVLKVDLVGIHDNFFELGGHSLLATQLISRIRTTFKVELPLHNLLTAATVAQLAKEIEQWQQQQLEQPSPLAPLPIQYANLAVVSNKQERYKPFPLNDIQQAYWIGRNEFFALGNISTHSYVEVDCVNLDIERFEQAWQRLIERHEMLRAIVWADGQQQILQQVAKYEIAKLDLRGENPQRVESQLTSIREHLSHQVLVAEEWPLFEIQAVQLDGGKVRICMSFDALIADAWSMGILSQELGLLMQNPLREFSLIEVSFRDYVLAEIAYRQSPQYQRSLEYWHNRIPTLPPAPQLPLSKNISQVQQPKFVRRSRKLEVDKWECLKAKARQVMVTPSVLLLAAFAEVLSVWSQNPEFTINLTLFNRLTLHPQVNEIVGDFTSLTLMAINNRESEAFAERLRRIQQQLWLDLEHRDVSGTQVLRELGRQQGRTSGELLMPVVFTSKLTHNSSFSESLSMEWLGEVVYSVGQTPQVYLDHQVSEVNGELVFDWDAVEELFPLGLLDEMFAAYCNFLLRLAQEDKIWQTKTREFLPPQQLKLLATVNDTQTPFSESALLHSLFFEQALNQPQKIAVVTTHRSLTYQELSQYALNLGHQLRRLGVQPNQLVAVVMAKGWEQIVAVLGILASGAAYVPVDPQLPLECLFHLLDEAQVQVVLTQQRLTFDLEWPDKVQLVCVDTLETTSSLTQWSWVQQPSDLAYVIYTSGSTGLPKGVMIDHRGAVNTILDINQRFDVSSSDRVLALSSLSFDLSAYDIFGTLAAGATIVVLDADATREPARWAEIMQQHQVSIWNSVPVMMQMLLNYASGQVQILPLSLRLVLLSGDWLPLALPDQLREAVKDVQVVSLGGATEASIWSVIYPIAGVDPSWKTIPYGRPMANQQFYVLNQALKLCPVWVPGQLYIGGRGLAKGYWRNEEKTNASFIIHPQTSQRLYRTGDLGRYLPDGNIEFLGREDFQVKVNGYRIELGEIEATLQQHPVVQNVVVTAIGEPTKDKHLVAYVVPKHNSTPEQSEAYEPGQLHGVITDPVERIEFKLSQPGIRLIQHTQTTVQLSKPEFDQALTDKYLQRQSYRQFLDEPITLEKLSLLLSCLLQMKLASVPLPKYRYASAGNLYPVQTYLFIKPQRIQGLDAGIYYYHPVEHQLVLMTAITEIDSSAYGGNQLLFENAAFSLFLIGELQSIAPMYGELAQNFCLLEAGYISHLLMETAPEYDIGLCPIGYLQLEKWRDVFALSTNQVLLHSFVGGGISPAQKRQWLHFPTASFSSSQSIEEQLRDWLRQKLPDYMIPSCLMILDALPLTANGKVDRLALPVPDKIASQNNYVPPRYTLELQLAQIWADVLNVNLVGVTDNFFKLGGHSLLAVRLMAEIQRVFAKNLPLATLFQNPTIEQLATVLYQPTDPSLWSPLVSIQPNGSQRPFFCIHPIGGNVLCFYHLASYLGSDQPFYGLQALGLNGESQPHTRVEEMAAYYIEAIQSVQPDGPYLLGGYSFGGAVAFEMAQQLLHKGHEVALLAMLDTPAPDFLKKAPQRLDWNNVQWLTEILSTIEPLQGIDLGIDYKVLNSISSEQEQLNYLKEKLQMFHVLPPKVGLNYLRGLIQVYKTNCTIYYLPQQSYPTQITLFKASDSLVAAQMYTEIPEDPILGWEQFSTKPVDIHLIPGNHLTILSEPNVQVLAARLKTCLEQAKTEDKTI